MEDKRTSVDQLNNEERLHLSILHGAKQICNAVGESSNPQVTFDRKAVALIGEIVWRKLQEMGSDLEHFAKHAKRTTIKPPDVLLLARRNPSLTEHLSKMIKVEERKKKKQDVNTAPATAAEAVLNAAVESNADSNDAFFKIEDIRENFYDRDSNMGVPTIDLSDED